MPSEVHKDETGHSPLPWHVEPEEWTEGRRIAICCPEGVVMIIDPQGPATAEDWANAHFVCRCVNAAGGAGGGSCAG